MRERPILLNAEMVRAVLDGRKTQSRRIIQSPAKNMQARGHECISYREPGDKWYQDYVFSMRDRSGTWQDYKHEQFLAKCPFGAVGDRLWVRETWTDVNLEGIPAVAYRADNDVYSPMDDKSFLDEDGSFNYDDTRVSKYHFAAWYGDVISGTEGNWRPSIHMPRWASRITLEITGVRVEWLQNISEADAKAEGLAEITKDGCLFKFGIPDRDGYPGTDDKGWPWTEWERYPVQAYRKLWQSIYGEESWKANPWVWVSEFKRLDNADKAG